MIEIYIVHIDILNFFNILFYFKFMVADYTKDNCSWRVK